LRCSKFRTFLQWNETTIYLHDKDRTALIEAKREAIKLRKAINSLRESHDKDHTKQRLALVEAKREAMITLREQTKLIEAHIVAKSETQKWIVAKWEARKLKCEERDEEIQKLTMDKETLAKEVATLKSRCEEGDKKIRKLTMGWMEMWKDKNAQFGLLKEDINDVVHAEMLIGRAEEKEGRYGQIPRHDAGGDE
jgi:cell division protein FtsB